MPLLFSRVLAGSANAIGGIFVILIGRTDERFIAGSMGFASGVMPIVSFLNLFVEFLDMTSSLNVERELERVQGEIESLQGQINCLERRVAMSAIKVRLMEPPPPFTPLGIEKGLDV